MSCRPVGAPDLAGTFVNGLMTKRGLLIKYAEELRQRRHRGNEEREQLSVVLSTVLETSISNISFHLYDNFAGEMSLSSFY